MAILLVSTMALGVSTLLISQEQSQTVAALASAQDNLNEAERQRQTAEENFQRARETVDTYLTKVSEETLLDQPGLQPLRKELLELALSYYQEFIEQHSDDPELQMGLADAYSRVGKITKRIGSQNDALDAHQQALKIREKLAADNPGDKDHQFLLAESLLAMARSHSTFGEEETVIGFFHEGDRMFKRCVGAEP